MIKPEDQVTSPEPSKKLKELGVKQESLFYWVGTNDKNHKLKYTDDVEYKGEGWFVYSAFTVAELGEMLDGVHVKWFPHDNIQDQFLVLEFYLNEIRLVNNKTGKIQHRAIAATEANARAQMLVYLIENKLINLDN